MRCSQHVTESIPDASMDAWREEIRRTAPANTLASLPYLEDGKTAKELACAFNMSHDAITRRLKGLLEDGKCEKGRALRTAINGQEKTVPVYRMITKERA